MIKKLLFIYFRYSVINSFFELTAFDRNPGFRKYAAHELKHQK